MKKNNFAILISTYDGAEDLWKPLEESYQRYWPQSSRKIYLTTNEKEFDSELFISLSVGDEVSWSDNILKSLEKIEEEYVLLTFDDLFLNSKVDDELVEGYFDWVKDNNANYFQFYRSVGKKAIIDDFVLEKSKESKYRNATVFSLWKKEVLISLLLRDENAWEFETKGNERAGQLSGFYCSRHNVFSYYNGVVKGKWNPIIKNRLLSIGYSVNIEAREQFTTSELISYEMKKVAYSIRRKLSR